MGNQEKVNWSGYCLAVVTPFTEDLEVSERGHRENIQKLCQDGVHGIIVGGSTGEWYTLSVDEKRNLYRWAREEAPKGVYIIAGCQGLRLSEIIEAGQAAREAKADGVMISPPPYLGLSPEELYVFYKTIGEKIRLPIMLYNHPKRLGVNMTPDVLEKLCEIEWVVALKESWTDVLQEFRELALLKERLLIFAGFPDLHGLPSWTMGVAGFAGAPEAQVLGTEGAELWTSAERGDLSRARYLQFRQLALSDGIRGKGTWPAPLKAAMNLIGRRVGPPRPPVQPVQGANLEAIRNVLRSLDLPIKG